MFPHLTEIEQIARQTIQERTAERRTPSTYRTRPRRLRSDRRAVKALEGP